MNKICTKTQIRISGKKQYVKKGYFIPKTYTIINYYPPFLFFKGKKITNKL